MRTVRLRTALSLCAALAGLGVCTGAELPETLRACTTEKDDSVRLACYDREVRRQSAIDAKSYGLSVEQKNKLERTPDVPKPHVQAITGVVADLKARPDGRTVITLSDGAVWVQVEAYDSISLRAGDVVTLKPGMLGSFFLYPRSGPPTRVRRLR